MTRLQRPPSDSGHARATRANRGARRRTRLRRREAICSAERATSVGAPACGALEGAAIAD
jgi:hypothetical protein